MEACLLISSVKQVLEGQNLKEKVFNKQQQIHMESEALKNKTIKSQFLLEHSKNLNSLAAKLI